eukprot:Lithocolla_globosa_v1_NODE_265_length_4744_cov_7.305396.p3 type:complete len:358 gc:universal NODE_265_length_4744_cov_7.305396:2266-1193(-)
MPGMMIHTRGLYNLMGDDPSAIKSWNKRLQITQAAITDLRWLAKVDEDTPEAAGEPIWAKTCTNRLVTDAAEVGFGWGAWINDINDPECWARGHWDEQTVEKIKNGTYTILDLEGLAVLNGIKAFTRQLRESHTLLVVDNWALHYIIRKRTTKRRALLPILREMQDLCYKNNISIFGRCEWLSSKDNWRADGLSRYQDKSDWKLHRDMFLRFDRRWGPHTIDRFASHANTMCRRYNSEFKDIDEEAVNSLVQHWERDNNWANPPWDLIARTIGKITPLTRLTLVAPLWESARWWPDLMDKADEICILPQDRSLFIAGTTCEPHKNPKWRVVVARFHGRGDFENWQSRSRRAEWVPYP